MPGPWDGDSDVVIVKNHVLALSFGMLDEQIIDSFLEWAAARAWPITLRVQRGIP